MRIRAVSLALFALYAVFCFAILCPAQVSVLTRHNDLSRTGQNLQEKKLTTLNVRAPQFGRLFSRTVDGELYAQPLYVPNLAIGGRTRNVVFLATAHNSVYAFDADDPAASAPLWRVNFGPSVPAAVLATLGLPVEVGIVGTPVIDPQTATLYVVSYNGDYGVLKHNLHALDLRTGAEKFGGPTLLSAVLPGIGDGNDGAGRVPFLSASQLQRCALTLANGRIYIPFASYEDYDPFHGWIFACDATTLQTVALHNNTPDGGGGGIWMSGDGMTVDASGNLYYVGGNGSFDGGRDIGESVVKLDANLNTLDWFAPWDNAYLNSLDSDLSSSNALMIPGTSLMVSGGKGGKLYVMDTTTGKMGHVNPSDDSQIFQSWQASGGHIHAAMTCWNSPKIGPTLYVWGEYDYLKAFSFAGNHFNTTPAAQSSMRVTDGYANGPGLSLSANGSLAYTGIVWANLPYDGDATHQHVPGILRAFDASNVSREIWNSKMAAGDDFGMWAKWVPPTVANGKVYLATFSNQLVVYGLRPIPAPFLDVILTDFSM